MVVCQFDKIQRVRTKWRFSLKDGIMNLDGKDYVFQKGAFGKLQKQIHGKFIFFI